MIGVLAIFLFSLGTPLVVLSGDIGGFLLAAITLIGGSGFLAIALKLRGINICGALKQPFSLYGLVGAGVGLYLAILYVAFKTAPAFEVNILNYLWPVLISLFCAINDRVMPKPLQIIGMVMGFVGMVLIFKPAMLGAFEQIQIGHVLALSAAVIWAFYCMKIRGRAYPMAILIPVTFVSGCACLVLHMMFEDFSLPQNIGAYGAILGLALLRPVYALWDYAMKHGNVVVLTSLSYFTPLLSSLYFIMLGFTPSRVSIAVAAILILVGSILINFEGLQKGVQRIRSGKHGAV